MWNRASAWNLVVSLVAFVFFMFVVDVALGFAMGIPELVVWFAVLVTGSALIIRRHVNARVASGTAGTD
jgi:hypothetical protein